MGSAFSSLMYSSICFSVILIRLLNDTKTVLATSKPQICGTMASSVARTDRMRRLPFVQELSGDRLAETEMVPVSEFLHAWDSLFAERLTSLAVGDPLDCRVDEFIHRPDQAGVDGSLSRPPHPRRFHAVGPLARLLPPSDPALRHRRKAPRARTSPEGLFRSRPGRPGVG
jgi:hypothetical protein